MEECRSAGERWCSIDDESEILLQRSFFSFFFCRVDIISRGEETGSRIVVDVRVFGYSFSTKSALAS